MKKAEEPPRILRRSERIRKLQETRKDDFDSLNKLEKKTQSKKNPSAPQDGPSRKATRTTSVPKTLKRKASGTNNAPPKKTKAALSKGRNVERRKQPAEELGNADNLKLQKTTASGITEARRIMPRNDRIKAIHEAIGCIPDDEDFYSDSQNFVNLPFPYLTTPRNLKVTMYKRDAISFFPFMGRKTFADVLQWYRGHPGADEIARRVVLHGPSGSGKNSILTALACFLTRMGHHVIYVPNCYTLAMDFVGTMVAALYLAVPEDLHTAIDAIREAEDIISLVNDFKKGYFVFILPDWDTFSPPSHDMYAIVKKDSLELVKRTTHNHCSICSVSSISESGHILNSKDFETVVIELAGGLSNAEMECWWKHNSPNLPLNLSAFDREKIQYYTGRLPSLLKGLLALSGRLFSEAEIDYWRSDNFSSFRLHARRKLEGRLRTLSGDIVATNSFVDRVKACLQEAELNYSASEHGDLCDALFYSDDGIGKCLTGDIREVATIILIKRIPTFMDDGSWLTLLSETTNPFSKKFLLAQVCLTRISLHGLEILDDKLKQMPFEYYDELPDWSSAVFQEGTESANELCYLFIRERTIGSLIDGIILHLNKEDNLLELFFIQVGPCEDAECGNDAFYSLQWKTLRESLAKSPVMGSYSLRSTFVFLHFGSSGTSSHVQKKSTVNRRKVEYRLCRLGCSIVDGVLNMI